MTTTACAIDQSVAMSHSALEIATITPGYAAARAHRPLKSRMGSRSALLGSSVMAGVFGLMAAEAVAQQYNLSGSGGFTDVSSSINVVTDAGAGNIRVILADGVQFVAAPGQYQLNPMTNQLQVSTDVLLGAYTGGAPMAAMQSSQAMMAGQQLAQASYGAPMGMATYQPQVFTAGQYASQPSIVGGYQMQPSQANLAYNSPMAPNLNPQPTQYVPAYSAGAQMAQMPGSFGGGAPTTFGAQSSFGGPSPFAASNPIPVTQMVPTAEVAAAPAPVATTGGFMGLPTWALVGGGVVAAGAAVMASGALGGDGSSTTSSNNSGSSASNYTISQQAFLSDPAVQAALNGGSLPSDDDEDDDSSNNNSNSGNSSNTNNQGITITGGTGGSTTTSNNSNNVGASATIAAGRRNDDISGTSGDDTVIFEAAEDSEEFNSLDLSGGDDTVILKDMDSDVTPEDLNNVETVEVEVRSGGHTLSMDGAGDDVETVFIDANEFSIKVTNIDTVETVAVSNAQSALVTIEDVSSGHTVALTESNNAKITGGSVLNLNVSDVSSAVEIASTTTETLVIEAVDSTDNAFDLTAAGVKTLTITGGGALTVTNLIGNSGLAAVTAVDASSASGAVNLSIDGTVLATVDTGSAGDMLHIRGSNAAGVYSTNAGQDTVEVDDFGGTATLDTGSGGDKIELDIALISTDQMIDGGEGVDTLEVSKSVASGDYDNIETLEIGGSATAIDLSLFDSELETVEVETTAGVSLTDVAASHSIETIDGADVTISSGTSDEAMFIASGDLTIANSSTGTSVEDLTLSFASNSTSTLTLTGTATETLVIDDASAAVAIVGSAITAAVSAVTSIDASSLTTAVTIGVAAGTGAGDISNLSLGSGEDTAYIDGGQAGADISMGAGDDTIDASDNDVPMDYEGGAGMDTILLNPSNGVQDDIVFAATSDFVVVTGGTMANLDTISGFDSGEDKVDLNALNLTGISDEGASLNDAYTAVNDGTVDVAFADSGGNTYVYVDLGNSIGAFELSSTSATISDFNL